MSVKEHSLQNLPLPSYLTENAVGLNEDMSCLVHLGCLGSFPYSPPASSCLHVPLKEGALG